MASVNIVKQLGPDATRFGESFRTLFRWKDSVYKLLWRHMLIYYILYISLTLLYYFVLDKDQQGTFRKVTTYLEKNASSFNLMIMLGFFTSAALQRLFNMQSTMPGTARVISVFLLSLKPDIPRANYIIERYSRWAVVSWLLTFRIICKPLRELYPDMISLQKKGFITESERVMLERVETRGEISPRPLIVINWMLLSLKELMLREQFIHNSCYSKCFEAVMAFKKSCGNTIKLTSRNIPHAVIQAVIIAVYFFGMLTILARELPCNIKVMQTAGAANCTSNCSSSEQTARQYKVDYSSVEFIFSVVPIVPAMKFFIFFSWLTFGRAAVNPFGKDYTDIDVIQLLECHLEDAKRLKQIHSGRLDEIFPCLPDQNNASAIVSIEPPITPKLKTGQQQPTNPESDCRIFTIIQQN